MEVLKQVSLGGMEKGITYLYFRIPLQIFLIIWVYYFWSKKKLMKSRIEFLSKKYFVGLKCEMTFSNDKTRELWQNFRPMVSQIKNKLNTDFYSLQKYDGILDFNNIDANKSFTKWALVEVSNFENIADTLEKYILFGGKYVVFNYKGPASEFMKAAQYIYGYWFPNSEYQLDDREHFEILGENYKPYDINAEEEIWIPIK